MAKIFISYRRDDARADARGLRDRLARAFGSKSVFMDVDNLLIGQRFDQELQKALEQCDVFLAVIGPRWTELLSERQTRGERDYVRDEIAAALKRGAIVIPVLVDDAMMPSADALPDDLRELTLYQAHNVTHARFGRDADELIAGIKASRRAKGAGARSVNLGKVAASLVIVGVVGALGAYVSYNGLPGWTSFTSPSPHSESVGGEGRGEGRPLAPSSEVAPHPSPLSANGEREERAKSEAERKTDDERLAKAIKETVNKDYLVRLLKERSDKKELVTNRLTDLGYVRVATGLGVEWLKPGRGKSFRDCKDVCPEMVVVPAGSFMMGSHNGQENEAPLHKVTIPEPIAVGRFEVTFYEWDACVSAGGCRHKPMDLSWGRGRRPVIFVSWDHAHSYLSWLSKKTGWDYRLLSEAEWEYAARAGTTTNYAYGPSISKQHARFATTKTAIVGSFLPNRFGLYDMQGNLWEWVADCWNKTYNGAPSNGSSWISGDCKSRVLRGGAWRSKEEELRSAKRVSSQANTRFGQFGFRVARNLGFK